MRVVVKVGTSSLTNAEGHIKTEVIQLVSQQLAAARAQGHEVLLVTSGAVASGVAGLGLAERPSDVLSLQALSAVGQPQLMAAYNNALKPFSLVGAQVLLVPHDFVDRQQYLHARDTIGRLLELGCVPIINENDAIANNEIRYGDNDHLAALLAHLVSADMLVLLTDTAGLYTSDPRINSEATVISVVAADDPLLSVSASGAGSDRGSGGMASKLAAARIASWSGVTAVIAAAESDSAVMAAINGDVSGTRFLPHDRQLSARKLWIAFAAEVEGSVVVDAGARDALVLRGTSLLPAGVTAVTGSFEAGAVVEVITQSGELLARGLTAMSSDVIATSMGKRTVDLVDLAVVETVHRDDLVVLTNQ
ncbi:MAG: glutamate 5-kinase [Ilumatobacteraceae bacterium]|nr:glutamate 5-kinase [Ilumatobacteraceae bacterium]